MKTDGLLSGRNISAFDFRFSFHLPCHGKADFNLEVFHIQVVIRNECRPERFVAVCRNLTCNAAEEFADDVRQILHGRFRSYG